jgi:hypothetical protein
MPLRASGRPDRLRPGLVHAVPNSSIPYRHSPDLGRAAVTLNYQQIALQEPQADKLSRK